MALGYLASYQHMGSFSVECEAGCTCEGVHNHTAFHPLAIVILQNGESPSALSSPGIMQTILCRVEAHVCKTKVQD